MVTTANIRSTPGMGPMIASVFREAGKQLTQKQDRVLNNVYVRHTGELSALLSSNPTTVQNTSDSATMRIRYMAQIRFLDLKKTAKGKKKKRYRPIYNKYVFGFLMGYTYNHLRQGLTRVANQSLPHVIINVNI